MILTNFLFSSLSLSLCLSLSLLFFLSLSRSLRYTGFSSATLAENAGVQLQKDYSVNSDAAVTIPTIFGVLFNGVCRTCFVHD